MDMIVHRGPIWRSTALSFTHNYRLRATVYHFKCEGLISSTSFFAHLGTYMPGRFAAGLSQDGIYLLIYMDAIGLFQNASSILSAASPIKVGAYYGYAQIAKDSTHSFPNYNLQSNTACCAIAFTFKNSEMNNGIPAIDSESHAIVIAPGYGDSDIFVTGPNPAVEYYFLYTSNHTFTLSAKSITTLKNIYAAFMMVVIEYGT